MNPVRPMLPLITRVVSFSCAILESTAAAFLAAVLLIVFMQVTFRYVFGAAVPWTEEAARYLNVWAVFLACAAAVAQNAHLRVTFLLDLFSGVFRRVIEVLIALCVIALDVGIIIGGIQLIELNIDQQATTFPVSVSVLYMAVTVYGICAVVFGLIFVWRLSAVRITEET